MSRYDLDGATVPFDAQLARTKAETQRRNDLASAVEWNGDSAGRREYSERRHDVEVCGEPDVWCWPLGDADEAYINRVGLPAICQEIGIEVKDWQTWGIAWVVVFRKGYEAAHEQWRKDQVSK